MEEETKLENNVISDFFIEEKRIKEIRVADIQTPLKDVIYDVEFEDAPPMQLSRMKFEAIRTTEKSDASSARERLVKEIGIKLYGILVEYGIKMSEIDPVLNEAARLVNDAQSHALDILWGKDMYTRSLLDVNRVLLSKYGSEPKRKDEDGDDAVASSGSTTDSEDTK